MRDGWMDGRTDSQRPDGQADECLNGAALDYLPVWLDGWLLDWVNAAQHMCARVWTTCRQAHDLNKRAQKATIYVCAYALCTTFGGNENCRKKTYEEKIHS